MNEILLAVVAADDEGNEVDEDIDNDNVDSIKHLELNWH